MLQPIPAGAQVLIVGDSYTQGYGSTDEKALGWAPLAAQELGWSAVIDGVGGTGFAWGGGDDDAEDDNSYPERLARLSEDPNIDPALVVLQGGGNDYRSSTQELRDAVSATVAAVHQYWPKAQVLLFESVAPQPLGDQMKLTLEPVTYVANKQHIPFIDGSADRWFTAENSAQYGFTDGFHVNDAGHAYIADQFAAAVQALTVS